MLRKPILLTCLLMLIVTSAGCATLRQDPNAELLATAKVYASVQEILIELKAQGQLGADEIEDVSAWMHLADRYLAAWQASIEAGKPDAEIAAAFELALAELNKVLRLHE